jgi:hypothetical protein
MGTQRPGVQVLVGPTSRGGTDTWDPEAAGVPIGNCAERPAGVPMSNCAELDRTYMSRYSGSAL